MLRRARRGGVALAASALILAAVAASPAHAWYAGHAYLVVNNWRCVGGGKVNAIAGAVDTMWSGGDAGDNIIWPVVRVGATNQFNGWANCTRPWYQGGDYHINVAGWYFTPGANNQTFWY